MYVFGKGMLLYSDLYIEVLNILYYNGFKVQHMIARICFIECTNL